MNPRNNAMKNLHLSKENFFRQPRFQSNISASQHLQHI